MVGYSRRNRENRERSARAAKLYREWFATLTPEEQATETARRQKADEEFARFFPRFVLGVALVIGGMITMCVHEQNKYWAEHQCVGPHTQVAGPVVHSWCDSIVTWHQP